MDARRARYSELDGYRGLAALAIVALLILVLLAQAALVFAYQTHLRLHDPAWIAADDFTNILRAAQQLRAGLTPYPRDGIPSLNHPILAVVQLPLAWLSPAQARAMWLAISLVCALTTVAVVVGEMRERPSRAALFCAAIFALTSTGALDAFFSGQVVFPLALLVALAWRCHRRGQMLASAALCGVVVALKPFLLPLLGLYLARCAWRGLGAAGLGAAGISALALPFVGLSGYADFGRILLARTQVAGSPSIGLPSLLLHFGFSPGRFAILVISGTLGLSALALLRRESPRGIGRADRDVLVLLAASILASPLGWVYYLPLLVPLPVVIADGWAGLCRARRTATIAGLALLAIPGPLLWIVTPPSWGWTMPLYTAGVMLAVLAFALPARPYAPHC